MNHKLSLFIIIVLTVFFSCNDDDDSSSINTDQTSIRLVTGLNIKMSDVSAPIRLGNPNVFTENQFVAFPNPPADNITIQSLNSVSDIWFITANAEKIYQDTNFDALLGSDLYTEDAIRSRADLQFNDLDNTNLTINLDDLNPGYYKVFIKIDGSLYWDNIYIAENNFDITDLINFWE